jgi:hypothetical protein
MGRAGPVSQQGPCRRISTRADSRPTDRRLVPPTLATQLGAIELVSRKLAGLSASYPQTASRTGARRCKHKRMLGLGDLGRDLRGEPGAVHAAGGERFSLPGLGEPVRASIASSHECRTGRSGATPTATRPASVARRLGDRRVWELLAAFSFRHCACCSEPGLLAGQFDAHTMLSLCDGLRPPATQAATRVDPRSGGR